MMKTNFIARIIAGCITIMALVSCESHEQKADDAFERFKEKKMISKDSNTIIKKNMVETKNTQFAKNNTNQTEWEKFKAELEKKIRANENKIKEIKSLPNANAGVYRKVASLEKDNNDLLRQLDQYNEDVKVMWENFKVKLNHDANEIGIKLKDIKISNNK